MTAFTNDTPRYYVIHPLDDAPEQKCSAEGLGAMQMSKSVKASLITLRGYLILVTLLTLYRLLDLLGLFGHHVAK
jgi:hypothetical protein